MGVTEYSIFDSGKAYPRKRKPIAENQGKGGGDTSPKKYHTGYISGVFDLFHIGHLNMFKRAKEQCDYLIVGVVTDEGVRTLKEKEPFIPFDERIEMVRSCRYVDEAVEIPLEYHDTRNAWRLYHFDCQFSGSDYTDNPNWLANKKFLEEHGAEMVFFSYTEQTSSTKIKELIERGLA
ncbi:MAG: adenylyltransferase/cytidyltransferase family protein [Lachnospiraceae bacterium]|nr:adenylyltransferase/cytidyltransferase family protein [Lachnospiraceae bacterium]